MSTITITPHGKFVVKAGHVGDAFVGRLFSDKPKAFRGHILESRGSTAIEATEQVIADFDRAMAIAGSSRRLDSITGAEVPTRFEFETVLRMIDIPEHTVALLGKLRAASANQITVQDFARVCHLASARDVIDGLEKLGAAICRELECEVPAGMRYYMMLRIPTGEFPKDVARLDLQPEFSESLVTLQQGSKRSQSSHAA
ncbi:MAG: hypothetical protein ACK4IA_17145 [Paracoccus hibiscisoli]|uniref:hypothetical protein n=1 Tax=Paracoccus hibiscisoli TaxID=2023261 RepID=UPI00391C3767